ncbi:hypothetical protein WJX84_006858 [Apatococcus fuscideae]|uniref:Uncharacterized protein n=1 Tax=Apatococcus fuscideae TaxID=2026836 RepID=A0AAW1TF04_9CHLO
MLHSLEDLHDSLASAPERVQIRASLEEALQLALTPISCLREEGFKCLANLLAEASSEPSALNAICNALQNVVDPVLGAILKSLDAWSPAQQRAIGACVHEVSLREFEASVLALQGLALLYPPFRDAARVRGVMEVLLHKLDLDHRATKRLCIRGLDALVVDSMPNILRMTEVSGIEKVCSVLRDPRLPTSLRACCAELLSLITAELRQAHITAPAPGVRNQ